MDVHYNAFISYRHHPLDIKVASEIQRSLEHYKVPRSLRKTSKKITRLFRDKDELPITSNLTTDITHALENSDYLIVICSTHTKESTWVQREIETFLQTHDKSKILTVLVDGEPYDTIPEILLSDERIDPVTGEVTKVPIEPLSCDWRVKRSKAKREELPRLAAALLGCGYNELRQRERQYRTRRMITAFSAAMTIVLCFMGYFIYSNLQIQAANDQLNVANQNLQNANVQIQNNLDQALRNQSLFLANTSTDLLENGDRLTAIALALEALPKTEGERPYVAEAEFALNNAVGTYQASESVVAVGAFTCDYLISVFKVTDDGRLIYIQDERGVVTVWDTETLLQVGSVTLDFTSSEMVPTSEGNMVLFDDWSQKLLCCDSKGTILWSVENVDDFATLEGQDVLMTVYSEFVAFNSPYEYTVQFLDMNTGEEVQDSFVFSGHNATVSSIAFLLDTYAPDLPVCMELSDSGSDHLVILDTVAGGYKILNSFERLYIHHAGQTNEGNILFIQSEGISPMRGTIGDIATTAEEIFCISCVDCNTGEILWEVEVSTYVFGFYYTLEMIPESSRILCQIDNAFMILESTTGEILAKCEAFSCPIWTKVDKNETQVLLENGHWGYYDHDRNECIVYEYMNDVLAGGEIQNGIFIQRSSGTQIIVYRAVRDTSWVKYECDYTSQTIQNTLLEGDLLAVETYNKLYVFDTKAQSLLWSDEGDYSFNTEILGASEDGSTLWCVHDDCELVGYDFLTGTAQQTELPRSIDEMFIYYTGNMYIANDKIYCLTQDLSTDDIIMICWDTKTGTYTHWYICTEAPMDVWTSQVTNILTFADDYILLWENTTQTIYEVDLRTNAVTTVMTDVPSCPAAAVYDDSRYLLGCNNTIQLCDRSGNVSMEIPLEDLTVGAFYVHQGQILALCDDGNMYRYNSDGTYVASVELHVYYLLQSSLAENPFALQWHFLEDGSLILDIYGLCNIIDWNSGQNKAYIKNFVAYLPNSDEFVICASGDPSGIGACARVSLDQLIVQAKEILGEFELTEEQKIFYGLLDEQDEVETNG